LKYYEWGYSFAIRVYRSELETRVIQVEPETARQTDVKLKVNINSESQW